MEGRGSADKHERAKSSHTVGEQGEFLVDFVFCVVSTFLFALKAGNILVRKFHSKLLVLVLVLLPFCKSFLSERTKNIVSSS